MVSNIRNELTDLILKRLNETKEHLKQQFFLEHHIKVARHFVLDNLLPTELAESIYASFPQSNDMRSLSISGKLKLKYSHLRDVPSILQDINFAMQDPKIVAVIEDITEIKNQIPDPSPYAGGISTLLKGYYINPHLDLSHDVDSKYYRTVNVLYYVSPNWQVEYGGNYELWDCAIKNRIVVPNFFNRMLVMETNRSSWHAVNTVTSDEPRCCVFNYFFLSNLQKVKIIFSRGFHIELVPNKKFVVE
ncbi:2OG-Fe(II) oxygenase [Legionella sainthelensi]|uniref:2OG-Fe(II) oxygenase n=1 Tax=Legionella sainthelensi TaxID=28087 RepID=UPI000F6C2D56|nr:2OG-Fe(II) oxygenase [Legionella sainthelensi]VEH35271.1 Predicted proline hydroxylase [Legionella sainthelensi]